MKAKQMHKMCLRKIRYKNEIIALEQAKRLEKIFKVSYRVYYCKLCNGFHLTTKE